MKPVSSLSTDLSISPSTLTVESLLKRLIEGFGWQDKQAEMTEASQVQHGIEQKLSLAAVAYLAEPHITHKNQLIAVLIATQEFVQKEYDHVLKQPQWYSSSLRGS